MPSLFELDNYESCLDSPEAVYCVASMELYGDSSNKIYNTIRVSTNKVFFFVNKKSSRPSQRRAYACKCSATVVGSIPTRRNGLLFINIFISSFNVMCKMQQKQCKNARIFCLC